MSTYSYSQRFRAMFSYIIKLVWVEVCQCLLLYITLLSL